MAQLKSPTSKLVGGGPSLEPKIVQVRQHVYGTVRTQLAAERESAKRRHDLEIDHAWGVQLMTRKVVP
jgi:hypothetical protein